MSTPKRAYKKLYKNYFFNNIFNENIEDFNESNNTLICWLNVILKY